MSIHFVNKFGNIKEYYDIGDVKPPIYILNTGCISQYTDALSWANANNYHVTKNPISAKSIIILGCQSSDVLAYHSFMIAKELKNRFLGRDIYIGGCLGRRADIEIPEGISRINLFYNSPKHIDELNKALIKDLNIVDQDSNPQNLFETYYPIRIGMGSNNPPDCSNIDVTRTPYWGTGKTYSSKQILSYQFVHTDRAVVIVSDDPTPEQINWWIEKAIFFDKPISLINISPTVAIYEPIRKQLINAARCRKLSTFHSPILSNKARVLNDLDKNVSHVHRLLQLTKELKKYNVYCTTSVLVDYKDEEHDYTSILDSFNIIKWRPWWNNSWDETLVKQRVLKYASHAYGWVKNGTTKSRKTS